MEFDDVIQGKEAKIQTLNNEYNQKMNELNELNEMITENDSKYKKIIKDNKDALDSVLRDLKLKEDEYHDLLIQVDNISNKRSEFQNRVDTLDKELKSKDDLLKRIISNLEFSQSEIKRLNGNIIDLTENEAILVSNRKYNILNYKQEEKVTKLIESDEELSSRNSGLKTKVERLSKLSNDLENKVKLLQVKVNY